MAKQPSFQFYPGDWLKDPALQSCSNAVKGVWMQLLCYAFECEPRGFLVTAGVPWDNKKCANVARCRVELVTTLIAKKMLKVCNKSGAYYSKRMVEDERLRSARADSGRKGGKQKPSKPAESGKQKAPPSSSSSSSSSTSVGAALPPTPPEGGIAIEIFAALVLEFHSDGIAPADERSLRKVLPDFEKLCGQNPSLIAERAKEWRVLGNHKILTPQLLRKHWSALRTDDLLNAWKPTQEQLDELD